MNIKNTFYLLVLIVVLGPISLFGQKEIRKTFNGIKKIRLTTASGNCSIKKSDNAAVTVLLKHTYDDDEYTPSLTQEGDRLVIKEKFHDNNSNGSADWTLTVPDNLDIEFTTGSGDVDAAGLSMDLTATTGSGTFVFTNTSGEIKCNTGSGNVELENVDGVIHATSGSGSFRVAKSKGELMLTSGSGNFKLSESTAIFKVTTGSGNINGGTLALNGSSGFTTGSGKAEIGLASSPKYDLSLTSGSGDAILNFNGNEINGEIVMRASKKHGNIEAPFAFDKTEEINNSGGDHTTVQKTALKGNGKPRIAISTGSGDAVLKK